MSTLSVDTIQGKTTAGTVAMPAGVIIQTVNFTTNTQVDTNTSTFTNTGLSGTITPKFASSKIYVTAFQQFRLSGVHDHGVGFKIMRTIGGTASVVYDPQTRYEYYYYDGTANNTSDERHDRMPIFAVDSPNTTSACTYDIQYGSMRTDNSNNIKMQNNSNFSMGYLMEIAQ